ncbi:MAG: nickel pincer cofactor biosynthesis protein LarB [Thermodesulfobacteriota bacterium]|nr:nickel pincer cofactor biosynthesis protein LarB [Thermodesulfobacteriota bacterium]
MNSDSLKQILSDVSSGKITVDKAVGALEGFVVEDLGYAHVDHHRCVRKGFPEVIFGAGKTPDQICGIMERIYARDGVVMVTRVDDPSAQKIQKVFPDAVYHAAAKMVVYRKSPPEIKGRGTIAVISAGTSDIPVASEAALTAETMGNRVETLFDVGVAGIHRLFSHMEQIQAASVLIVVAGMEGALPSVVAGLTAAPVIAVPTSVGYGASLGGLTALFGMLNSCSSNVAVVNIDNGFGAGFMAASINRK